jgi:putative membrane protein
MKILPFTVTLTIMTACLSACHSPDQKWDSKSSADTLNNMKDSVADSSKAMSRELVMKVNKEDAKFAVEAANGGLAEVELGKLAQQQAADPQEKEFGGMMVTDHSKANEEMKNIAKNKGITLPAALSSANQKLKEELASKKNKDFDKAYVKDMIEDHEQDIKEFESAIHTLQDAELKAFATKTLPVLRKHLDAIKKIEQAMKSK